jgi:general secretion pathway protein J
MMEPRGAATAAGFTLLELVVALTLTSLVVLVAFTSLNLSLKAAGRGQAAVERLQELRVGRTILVRSLSSAVRGLGDTRGSKTYFVGEPHQVRFFTLLPLEAHNLGGAYHWRAMLAQDEASQGVLAVEQTRDLNWQRDPEGVEIRQFILKGITSLRFTYGKGSEEFETWDGAKLGQLPEWVRVKVALAGQESQIWLIPIHVAETRPKAK